MSLLGQLPPYIRRVAEVFARAKTPLYAVGGCVRGALMGLPAADYDLCGPAATDEVLAMLAGQGGEEAIRPTRVYGRMGTMRLTAREGYAEYTTFRRESYSGGHTPDRVEFTASLEQDAFRRDFSCNALYLNLRSGELVDPTGGEGDIRARRLRATTRDPSVIMRDDGLRVLRMVRFAAQLRFAVEPATFACADAALLPCIARERLAEELSLILLSDARYDLPGGREALRGAVEQLVRLGAAEVLLPGLALDAGACADVAPDLPLRFAALLRGNPAEGVRAALRALRYPLALSDEAAALVRGLSLDAGDRFALAQKGFPFLEKLCALRPDMIPAVEALRASGAPDSLEALALDGADVAAALGGPSPRVGAALRELWRYAVAHPAENTREGLEARLFMMGW